MGVNDEWHESADNLAKVFTRANRELTLVQHKLEKEFQQNYPDNLNPMKFVARIKRMQDVLLTLKEECHELLAAKQDLIDKARTLLVGNRNLIQRMQVSVGVSPANESDDSALDNFNQIINEWTAQIRSKQGNDGHDSDSEDVNRLLFSSIVQR